MEVKLQVQLHRDVVDRIATFKVLFEDLRSLFPDQYNHQHYDDLDFEATVSVYEIVKFLNINDQIIITKPRKKYYFSIIEISTLSKSSYILYGQDISYVILAARSKIVNYFCPLEFVKIINPDQTYRIQIDPSKLQEYLQLPLEIIDVSEPGPNDESVYRLYLDDIMIIERIFPSLVDFYSYIEENQYVSLDLGKHHIRVETIRGPKISIFNVLIDGKLHSVNDCETYINIA